MPITLIGDEPGSSSRTSSIFQPTASQAEAATNKRDRQTNEHKSSRMGRMVTDEHGQQAMMAAVTTMRSLSKSPPPLPPPPVAMSPSTSSLSTSSSWSLSSSSESSSSYSDASTSSSSSGSSSSTARPRRRHRRSRAHAPAPAAGGPSRYSEDRRRPAGFTADADEHLEERPRRRKRQRDEAAGDENGEGSPRPPPRSSARSPSRTRPDTDRRRGKGKGKERATDVDPDDERVESSNKGRRQRRRQPREQAQNGDTSMEMNSRKQSGPRSAKSNDRDFKSPRRRRHRHENDDNELDQRPSNRGCGCDCVDCTFLQRPFGGSSTGSCSLNRHTNLTTTWTLPSTLKDDAVGGALWASYRVYAAVARADGDGDDEGRQLVDSGGREKRHKRRPHRADLHALDDLQASLASSSSWRSLRRRADRTRRNPVFAAYRKLLGRQAPPQGDGAEQEDDGSWLLGPDSLCALENSKRSSRKWRLWVFQLRANEPGEGEDFGDDLCTDLQCVRSGSFELSDVRSMTGAATLPPSSSPPLTPLESICIAPQAPICDDPWRMLARSIDTARAVRAGEVDSGIKDDEPLLSVTANDDVASRWTISLQHSSLVLPSPPLLVTSGEPVLLWPLNRPTVVVQTSLTDVPVDATKDTLEIALRSPVRLPPQTRWTMCWVPQSDNAQHGNLIVWPQHLLSRDPQRSAHAPGTDPNVDRALNPAKLPPTPPLTPLPDSSAAVSQLATDDDVDLGPLLGASPATVGPVAHDSVDAVSSKLMSPHPLVGDRADSATGADDWESLTGERTQHAPGLGVTDDDFDFFDAPHGPDSSKLETIEEREEYAALWGPQQEADDDDDEARTSVPADVVEFKQQEKYGVNAAVEEEPLPVYEQVATVVAPPLEPSPVEEVASQKSSDVSTPKSNVASQALIRRRRMHAALACIKRDVSFVRKLGDGRVKDRMLQRQSLKRLARFLAIQAEILEDEVREVDVDTEEEMVTLPAAGPSHQKRSSSFQLLDATALLGSRRWHGIVDFADVQIRYNVSRPKRIAVTSIAKCITETPAMDLDEALSTPTKTCLHHVHHPGSTSAATTTMIRAGHSGLIMDISSSAIAHWQTLGLQPLSGRKRVTTAVLFDATAVDDSLVTDWHHDLTQVWMSSGFGELQRHSDASEATLLLVIGRPDAAIEKTIVAARKRSRESLVVIESVALASLRDRRGLSSLALRLYDRIPLEVQPPRSRFLTDQSTSRPKRYLPAPAFVLSVPPPIPTSSWTSSHRYITRDEIRTCHVAYTITSAGDDDDDTSGNLCAFVIDSTGEAWVVDRWTCDSSSPASLKDALGKLFWLMIAFCRAAQQLDWRIVVARYGLPTGEEIQAFHGILAEHKRIMVDFPTDIALFCSVTRPKQAAASQGNSPRPLRLADGRQVLPLTTMPRRPSEGEGFDHHLLLGASRSLTTIRRAADDHDLHDDNATTTAIPLHELSDDFDRLRVLGEHRWAMTAGRGSSSNSAGLPCHLEAVRRMSAVKQWS